MQPVIYSLPCILHPAYHTCMWQETERGLYRKFGFKDFKAAFAFMTEVADLAERHQHHPTWTNTYSKVEIWLITHDEGNAITKKDYDLAAAIDELV